MKCFYHSADLDGHCSGAIVKYFKSDCELIGINYGDDFPWDTIEPAELVYMVDFSLQPFGQMIELWSRCNLVWIDHHISAIKEFENHTSVPQNINGIRRDGIGACRLTWEFLTDKKVPYPVKLLAEYDVWNHTDPNTLPFQYGLRMENTVPSCRSMAMWQEIFQHNFHTYYVNNGKTVLKYITQDNEKYCGSCAFETELDGLKCIAVNKMLTNSKIFDSVWDPAKHDAMLTFGYRKGKWTVSLYTDKDNIDVSIIAKNRGGGGHKKAAGFQCGELPFKLK